MSRTEAESLRDEIRSKIRTGTLNEPAQSAVPPTERTFNSLADDYERDYVRIPTRRKQGLETMLLHVKRLRGIEIPVSGGRKAQLGTLPLDQIRQPDIEAVRRGWRTHKPGDKGGEVGANRGLARLRHMFNWAIAQGYIDHSPFKRHGVTVVKLNSGAETPRERRLIEGEEDKLIAAAKPRAQALIIAALETGCRIGELLSLQWGQVRWPENTIVLRAAKTKTNEARAIPMTSRLRAVLEMRRTAPDGEEFGPDAYVFGNEVGEEISYSTFKKGRRKACAAAGAKARHFHDLRREFASRLLETPCVSLHDVADWVGHSNVTTTSRYLKTTSVRRQHITKRFESAREARQASDLLNQPGEVQQLLRGNSDVIS